jgi:hypothetical protein
MSRFSFGYENTINISNHVVFLFRLPLSYGVADTILTHRIYEFDLHAIATGIQVVDHSWLEFNILATTLRNNNVRFLRVLLL